MERVAIFIDGSNFYHQLKDELGTARVDMGKLVHKLLADRMLVRTYYYNAPVDQGNDPARYQAQQRFFDRLRQIPYFQVRLGRLEKRPSGILVEKGVDLTIAVDMLQLAYRNVYDTAILISGDGDFAYVVNALKDLGKHVENAFLRGGRSKALADVCDKFIPIDKVFLQDISLPNNSSHRQPPDSV